MEEDREENNRTVDNSGNAYYDDVQRYAVDWSRNGQLVTGRRAADMGNAGSPHLASGQSRGNQLQRQDAVDDYRSLANDEGTDDHSYIEITEPPPPGRNQAARNEQVDVYESLAHDERSDNHFYKELTERPQPGRGGSSGNNRGESEHGIPYTVSKNYHTDVKKPVARSHKERKKKKCPRWAIVLVSILIIAALVAALVAVIVLFVIPRGDTSPSGGAGGDEGGGGGSDPGECSVTCGSGQMVQVTQCTGNNCSIANSVKIVQCNYGPCPDGSGGSSDTWGPWSAWSSCSTTCGQGLQSRRRTCPSCGTHTDVQDCNLDSCSSDSIPERMENWAPWSGWSDCSKTCGSTGTQTRTRECLSDTCTGSDTDTRTCFPSLCPVNGGWSGWSGGTCLPYCGERQRREFRTCTSPVPLYGGENCEGPSSRTVPCSYIPCPS